MVIFIDVIVLFDDDLLILKKIVGAVKLAVRCNDDLLARARVPDGEPRQRQSGCDQDDEQYDIGFLINLNMKTPRYL